MPEPRISCHVRYVPSSLRMAASNLEAASSVAMPTTWCERLPDADPVSGQHPRIVADQMDGLRPEPQGAQRLMDMDQASRIRPLPDVGP